MTWDKFITTNTEVPLKQVINLARAPSHTEALFQILFSWKQAALAGMSPGYPDRGWSPGSPGCQFPLHHAPTDTGS